MIKKVIILIIVYYILGLIQSCDLHYCEDVDFYDFTRIEIIEMNSEIESNDSLNFRIQTLDIDFMAQNQSKFEIIHTVSALSCDEGWAGMKFPIKKIEITSNSDFNDNHPANTLLNDIVLINLCTDEINYSCNYEYLKLNNIDQVKFMDRHNTFMADLYIAERPTIEKEHKFTIKLFKSNGDIITAESNSINWL